MHIIPQNYSEMLNKIFIEEIYQKTQKALNEPFSFSNSIFNYLSLSTGIDNAMNKTAISALENFITLIDTNYRNSYERRSKYNISVVHERTILTVFGPLTFKRTFYKSKIDKSSYCYTDRFLGLAKYDYFDPYIKAKTLEYAVNNSYEKTASFISNMIGKRITLDDEQLVMTRQTVSNIIKNSIISNYPLKERKTPETIYVMADEHFVASQDQKTDYMVKHAVVFEDIALIKRKTNKPNTRRNNSKNPTKRRKLVNPYYFSEIGTGLGNKIADYISFSYDITKIKQIIVMGDGAGWITGLNSHLKLHEDITVSRALDKYHFKQSLRRISTDEEINKKLEEYILNNMVDDFNKVIDTIIEQKPHREEFLEKQRTYLLNNKNSIQYLYNQKLSVPMESQISHNLADRFTSRPKGFNKCNLTKLVELRTVSKNKLSIVKAYINNVNISEPKTMGEDILDYSMFDKPEGPYKHTPIGKVIPLMDASI